MVYLIYQLDIKINQKYIKDNENLFNLISKYLKSLGIQSYIS